MATAREVLRHKSVEKVVMCDIDEKVWSRHVESDIRGRKANSLCSVLSVRRLSSSVWKNCPSGMTVLSVTNA